jgi:predicted DNA repair protein MutK
MPKLLAALSTIGIAAMIWVGGGIIVHGLAEFGLTAIEHAIHGLAVAAGHAVPAVEGAVEWTVGAAGAGLVGLGVGAVVVAARHAFAHRHEATR